MGGRGQEDKSDNTSIPDRFSWIHDVSTDRLQSYIDRSEYIGENNHDPQGRDIHTVSYYANIELERRSKS